MPAWHAADPAWPSGGGDVNLAAVGDASAAPLGTGKPVRAGTLPVWVGPANAVAGGTAAGRSGATTPARVHVQVAPRAAASASGIDGTLVSVSRGDGNTAAGTVHVSLSYASFANAYGGDWSSRLQLVELPPCSLTTPTMATCRTRTPIPFRNDGAARTLSADVTLVSTTTVDVEAAGPVGSPMVILAATSADAGGAGDFTATSLKPSGSWQAGGSSDSFGWSYPISVPDVPGGLAPKVTMSYASQSVDGLTSSTNNQSSWIGDGWDYSPGYIERSYQSCHENPAGATRTWDECWSANNQLTMSLNGSSTTLVKDDTTGKYHPANDANEKVEYLTGAVNGAQNGEYFQLTGVDGTRYIFGLNRLPGWVSGNPTTNSVWNEPVYATASGQPCYDATWANSWCQQAYRWNLDEVIDTHENTIAYFYQPKTAYYARNLGSTANTPYVRGGYLQKITYGQRSGSQYTTSPAAQVLFTTSGRCDSAGTGCDPSTLSTSTAPHWPDVPYDLNCANGAACTVQSPTFWSEYMLTGIQTQALAGTTETNVDSWALQHSFPATGEAAGSPQTAPALWLDSITRTGQDTTAGGSTAAITLPPVTFTGTPLANRVNLLSGYPAITRRRLNTINTETGATISVAYSQAICPTCTPSDPSTNTTLSYPVYWTRPGQSDPSLDWFNKYIITGVTQQDGTGGPPGSNDTIQTHYTAVGTPAWHHNDNPLTPANQRSWDQWRGYQGMTVTTGTAPDPVTKTTYTYFRGMDGDTLTNSGIRHVSITDSRGDPAVVDANQFASMTYETRVFNGSALVSDTITDPWTSTATATHTLSGGLPAQKAFHTGQDRTRTFTPLASGSIRQTETNYTHDFYGRVTKVNDQGDISTTTDDLCTTTGYADNTDPGWILDAPAQVKTVAVSCAASNPPTTATVADQLAFYDSSTTLGAAPTKGDVTMTKQVQSYTGSTPTYLTTATTTVDDYGRVLTSKDANNHTTTTTYTPAAGAQPTIVTVSDPLQLQTIITYDPLRGLPTKTTDPAGYITSQQYDALGRLTAVNKPGRAAPASPNLKFAYTVSATAPSAVSTSTLNEDATYRISVTLYDSMLRARETQTQTPDGKRVVLDTNYNTNGWLAMTTAPYFNDSPVSATYVEANPGSVDAETAYLYDGAGRKTTEVAYHLGTETWRTSYLYGGNFTTTVPPAGATPTTVVTDARGRTTHLVRYHAGASTDYATAPPSAYADTVYTYTADGKPATLTDPAGNSWSWDYDLLGRQTDAVDPDTGHTVSTYDNVGNLTTVTKVDDRNKQTTYTYDDDNRKTGAYDTTATSTVSAANQIGGWTYDTVKKGLLTSAVSYSAGDVFTSTVLAYNNFGLPAATKITVTGQDAAIVPAAGYTTSYGYSITGLLTSQSDPAQGGLPQENITTGRDAFGEPTSLASTGGASWTYVAAVGYDHYGQPLRYTMPTAGGTIWVDLTYDPQTRNLTNIRTTDSTTSGDLDNLTYTYDSPAVSKGAALLTKIVNKRNAGTIVDTQCFGYDDMTRLTQAWTATDNCATTPQPGNSATVGGPIAPYWQSWTYDTSGLRATQTDHDVTGDTTKDTTTTYHYPTPGSSGQPHTLTNTTATGPAATANTAAYTYDPSGNTTTITGGTLGNQTLTWNNQGKLATDQTAAGTTTYVYDADGNLLARRDPTATTLYLGDTQLVRNTATQTITSTRYYTVGGATIAARTNDGKVTCLIPDRQGTDQLSIDTTPNQTTTRRQYLPFGQPRGAAGAFPGDKGYIGGTTDTTTGLVNLGAREYNPHSGRFLSADPILDPGDPNQLNGYDYADNNPTTSSDPTGTIPADCMEFDCYGYDPENGCPGGCGSTENIDWGLANRKSSSRSKNHNNPDRLGHAVVMPDGIDKDKFRRMWNDQIAAKLHHWHGSDFEMAQLSVAEDEVALAINICQDIGGAACDKWIKEELWPALAAFEAPVGDIEGIFQIGTAGAGAGGGHGAPAAGRDVRSELPASIRDDFCSFSADTHVLMADGTTKSIKDIRVGDQVVATDPQSGETTHEQVNALHVNQDTQLTDVWVTYADPRAPPVSSLKPAKLPAGWSGPPATAVIHTTAQHRFWDETANAWVTAADLAVGDHLYTPEAASVIVTGTRTYTGNELMHNLTIANTHTYYVVADSTPVLVHNGCSPTSGANAANLGGTAIHGEFSDFLNDVGNGYSGARTLSDRTRVDGVYTDPVTKQAIPIELKPNNPAQIRKGWKRLEGYEQTMGAPAGSGQLWVYDVGPTGGLYFTRVF
jgi:RHS repeat-associated protein